MSKRRATSSNDGASNNAEQNATNANNTIINLDDSDDEDDDAQFVATVRPSIATIDLCVSPSTSAAAAAAAAAGAAAKSAPAGEPLKTVSSDAGNTQYEKCKQLKLILQCKLYFAGAALAACSVTSGADAAAPTATLECPICLQTCIHPARLPCGHIFCFLCVKVCSAPSTHSPRQAGNICVCKSHSIEIFGQSSRNACAQHNARTHAASSRLRRC